MVAILVLVAAYASTLDLSDTTTVRARTTQQISAPTGTPVAPGVIFGVDLANAASAALRARHGLWDYRLTYTPSITASDLELGLPPQAFQTASAAMGVHTRSLTISMAGSASYGLLNTSLIYAQLYQPQLVAGQSSTSGSATNPGQSTTVPTAPVPQQTIELGAVSGDLAAALRLDRRSGISLSGGYIFSGGLTETSRRYLPEQYGPHGNLSFRYQLSRRDGLVTTATGQEVETFGGCAPSVGGQASIQAICRGWAYVIQVQEGLFRQISRTATLSVSVGLARSASDAQNIKQKLTAITAATSFSQQFDSGGTSRLTLTAQVAPDVDVRTGLANDRLQVIALLTRHLTSFVTLNASATGLQTVPATDPYAVTAFGVSLGADLHFSREFFVTLGEQGFWQDQAGYGSFFSTYGFVAVTARAHSLRF